MEFPIKYVKNIIFDIVLNGKMLKLAKKYHSEEKERIHIQDLSTIIKTSLMKCVSNFECNSGAPREIKFQTLLGSLPEKESQCKRL